MRRRAAGRTGKVSGSPAPRFAWFRGSQEPGDGGSAGGEVVGSAGGFVWLSGGVDGGVPVEAAGVAVAEPFAVAADDAVAFPVFVDGSGRVVLAGGGSFDAVSLSLVVDGDLRFVKFFGPGVCANLGPGPR